MQSPLPILEDSAIRDVANGVAGRRFRVEVPADHPCFAGHFPGHPVLPAVVQLGLVLALWERIEAPGARLPVVEDFRFGAPVTPGVVLDVEIVAAGAGRVSCVIRCGERGVARGVLRLEATPSP